MFYEKTVEQGVSKIYLQILVNACQTSLVFFACAVGTVRVSHAYIWLALSQQFAKCLILTKEACKFNIFVLTLEMSKVAHRFSLTKLLKLL